MGERSGKEKKKSWVQANDESQYLSKLSWRMSGEWVVENSGWEELLRRVVDMCAVDDDQYVSFLNKSS